MTDTAWISLRELLACPFCHDELVESGDGLQCAGCMRAYRLVDAVPDFLPAERPVEQAPGLLGRALATVVAVPAVYDFVQRLAGAQEIRTRLQRMLGDPGDLVVLDIGAGTGMLETSLPPSVRYIWLDADPQQLAGFRVRSSAPAILADATKLPLRDDAVDWAISVGVSHHLDDSAFAHMLDEVRRVARSGLVFLDAVVVPTARNRLLWRYDRGQHPRPARTLWREIAARFEIGASEEFTLLHHYLLIRAGRR